MTQNTSMRDSPAFKTALGLFVFFLLWRFILYFVPLVPEAGFNIWSFAWGATYQIIALFGAVLGFTVAQSWGGWKSRLGRATIVLALGLLFQSIGQAISSYYVYTTGNIPYPSLGDIGFFGSVLFYIWASLILARLSGVLVSMRAFSKKLEALFIPLILLVASYMIFLNGQELDWSQPLTVLLNIGYPLGQAFYVAIALLTFYMSKDVLGGVMKIPILLFLVALIAQYVSDFTFLYQAVRGLYIPEGLNDIMYFVSYFLMTIALIDLGQVFKRIKGT